MGANLVAARRPFRGCAVHAQKQVRANTGGRTALRSARTLTSGKKTLDSGGAPSSGRSASGRLVPYLCQPLTIGAQRVGQACAGRTLTSADSRPTHAGSAAPTSTAPQRGARGPYATSMSVSIFQVLLATSTLPEVVAPPPPPPTLLHVGGHHAEEAKGYTEQGFSDRVVFIEAIPAAHSVCERVAARHGQACVNALLWDVDGVEQTFHVTTDSNGRQWSSSVFELTAANDRWREDQRPRPFAQMQLKSHRFDTLAAQYPSVLGRAFTHLVRWRSNPQGRSRSDGVAKPWILHDRC